MVAMVLNSESFFSYLASLTTHTKFCVAYSGGVDSHVLLHLLHAVAQDHKQVSLRAVHVNHGLSHHALLWQKHCEKVCAELTIPFSVYQLNLAKQPGESLEALARDKRYAVLANALAQEESLLTAHNLDDQAETLLLHLLRGAGIQGLAAMPVKKVFATSELLRPLLRVSRAEIEHYAKQNKLEWVEDESNTNLMFSRNYLRHQVMPLLGAHWEKPHRQLARSASHCAEALALTADVAAEDLAVILNEDHSVNIRLLLGLSVARQRNVLRHWFWQNDMLMPSEKQLAEIFSAVIDARADANPKVCWDTVEVRRYRDALCLVKPVEYKVALFEARWEVSEPLALPGKLGQLVAKPVKGEGIKEAKLTGPVLVRFRRGGEKIKLAGRKTQSLKKLLQAWEVPTWQRNQIPLLFYQDELICVAGFCVAEGFAAQAEDQGLAVQVVK